MVHSLSHRSKHRKMQLISVCEADDPLMSVLIGQIHSLTKTPTLSIAIKFSADIHCHWLQMTGEPLIIPLVLPAGQCFHFPSETYI